MEGGGECRINENERDSNKDFEDQIRKREKMKSFKRTEERGREESSVGRCGEGTGWKAQKTRPMTLEGLCGWLSKLTSSPGSILKWYVLRRWEQVVLFIFSRISNDLIHSSILQAPYNINILLHPIHARWLCELPRLAAPQPTRPRPRSYPGRGFPWTALLFDIVDMDCRIYIYRWIR